jgi:hypothetical protein
MSTTKATKATIKIGNISIDCYQMPDGCYKLAVNQVAKACNLDWRRFAEILEKKDVKALLPDGLVPPDAILKSRIETVDGIRQASLVDLKYVGLFWNNCGTPEGHYLASACIIEALERRADAAFGVVRSEEERNDRLAARVDHADGWRKNFTDWQQLDGCVTGIDYAIRVNQLKAYAGLPSSSIKDYDSTQVKQMTNAEVVYDAMRRSGKGHLDALKSL